MPRLFQLSVFSFFCRNFLGRTAVLFSRFLHFAIQFRLSYDDDGAVLQIDRRFSLSESRERFRADRPTDRRKRLEICVLANWIGEEFGYRATFSGFLLTKNAKRCLSDQSRESKLI